MAQKKSITQKSYLNQISNIALCLGFFFTMLSMVLYVQRYSPVRLAFDTQTIPQPVKSQAELKTTALPLRLYIPSQKINLTIISSHIKNKQWPINEVGVSYIKDSPIPGNHGNSIMFGHNWTNLLGNLVYVKPGEKIEITYSDRSKRKFIVENTAIVSPKDINILLPSTDALLTIYTCAGFLDSKRFVVTARPSQDG